MRSDREAALWNIAVGDIFHAGASNGASLFYLTMAVTHKVIQARNVATQIIHDFDRLDRRGCEAEYRDAEDPNGAGNRATIR